MKRLLIVLLSALLLSACAPARATDTMTLFAINVGKADALLLHLGETVYLIDTGSAESWGQLSCALRMLGITRLDGVIVTHTDKDHIGGVPMLAASSIEVGAWYASRYFADIKDSKHPVALAAESRGQQVVWLSDGDVLPFPGGSLTVLGPVKPSDEENDNSVVLLAEGAGGRILLMGDAELAAERALLTAHPDLPRCQVLKVGHHGGDNATSDALLALVQPEAAIISTSTAVRAETPAESVLQRLERIGARTAVTQDSGAGVLVTVDSGRISMELTDWAALPPMPSGIRLADRDSENDTIRLVNDSSDTVDLSGWYLRSDRGGETYLFPDGTSLPGGDSLTLGTLSTETAYDLLWPEKNVWHNKKTDAALLFDAYGRAVDTLD